MEVPPPVMGLPIGVPESRPVTIRRRRACLSLHSPLVMKWVNR
jgi:hypothetical protein